MRRIFIWLILILLGLTALFYSLPNLFSSDVIWAKINPILEQQLGRKFKVSGSKKLVIYPNIAIELADVEIADSQNAGPLVSLDKLLIKVDLMPLFSGQYQIRELSFIGADISLIAYKDGSNNWQESAKRLPEPVASNDPLGALIERSVTENSLNAASPTKQNNPTKFSADDLSISNFKIINSRISYDNRAAGEFEMAENINIDIDLKSGVEFVNINGSLIWRKQPVAINISQVSISDLLETNSTQLTMDFKSKPLDLAIKGTVSLNDTLQFSGNVQLNSPAIKTTANWLNLTLSDIHDGPLSFKSDLKISKSLYQLSQFSLSIFNGQYSGTLNVSNDNIPNIYGEVTVSNIDYNTIFASPKPTKTTDGWSQETKNLGIISQVNSNIALSIKRIKYDDYLLNDLKARLIVRKSVAKIPFTTTIFSGQIAGTIGAQPSKSGAVINAKIQTQNIDVGNALKQLKLTQKLAATADLTANIQMNGKNIQQWMSQMTGNGKLVMRDGVIEGIALADALAPEIAKIDLSLNSPEKLTKFALDAGQNLFKQDISNMVSGQFSNHTGTGQQTKFVKAGTDFSIKNGILTADNLNINSENIIIYGAGNIDLGKKQLNYRVVPKLASQNANGKSERMTIPVLIKGSWSAPQYIADFEYAIKNSYTINKIRDDINKKLADQIKKKITNKVVDKVKQEVTKQLGDKLGEVVGERLNDAVSNQVGNLLGLPKVDKKETDKNDQSTKIDDAANLLNQLFSPPK